MKTNAEKSRYGCIGPSIAAVLLILATLALASCETAPPPIDPATGRPMTFNKALGIGLMRLASETPPPLSMEEAIYGRRYNFARNTVPAPY